MDGDGTYLGIICWRWLTEVSSSARHLLHSFHHVGRMETNMLEPGAPVVSDEVLDLSIGCWSEGNQRN